jgi:lysophospholipase L1-like esterase
MALGDSITFGETDLHYRYSYGDRGYVSDFADHLAAKNGTRPKVINLAIDGETAASFMNTSNPRTPPVKGRTNIPLAKENLNYTSTPKVPQGKMFRSMVASQKSAGNSINTVTMTLGFNGLAALANLPKSKALAQIGPELASYKSNYNAVLSEVRQQLPNANLYLLNYYNPFPANPSSPAAPIFAKGGTRLNNIIKQMAAKYGAFYVDNFDPFVGHEAAYTHQAVLPAGASVPGPYGGKLPIGDVHPNAKGYSVIARDVEAAQRVSAVPEPAGLGLFGLGLAFVLGAIWKRRGYAASGAGRADPGASHH